MKFPRLKIERKVIPYPHWQFLSPLLAIITAFGISAVIILGAGVNPLLAYISLFKGGFGNIFSLSETAMRASPLLLTGLAVVIATKGHFFNIGYEGQLYAGAIAATWAAFSLEGLPQLIHLPLVMLFGFLGGASWVLPFALLKVKLGINEVLTTIMANYVMFYIVSFLLFGPWKDPELGWPQSAYLPFSALLPRFVHRLHVGIFIALACILFIYILIEKTTFGYKIRGVGGNPKAARAAGINVAAITVITAIISGGLAGLAGAIELSGATLRMELALSPGYGWTGIAVGLLAKLNPLGVILTAFFMGGLINGANAMQQQTAIPRALTEMMQGLIIVFILSYELLGKYKIKLVRN